MSFDDTTLAALIFIAALLYSSVGHGGASGYLAAMALAGVAPEVMKPTALALNILVASIACVKYYRVKAFSWPLFWPLALASIPFAYLGGSLTLPGDVYKPLVGLVLIFAAWRTLQTANSPAELVIVKHRLPLLLFSGGVLGLLSGLTGVGGGIFLSPLLLLLRWAAIKTISGTAAAFILVNSVSGLLGVLSTSTTFPEALPIWAIAAVAGGYLGAEYGSRRLGNPAIQKILGVVLLIAAIKMIMTA